MSRDILNILHVEDDEDIRGLVELAFDFAEDMSLVQVNDGLEGLKYLRHATPDVILLDDQMPNVSGHGVMSALKISSRLQQIPVIFATGHKEQEDTTRYLALGACAVLHKPFDPFTLPDFIRQSLKDAGT